MSAKATRGASAVISGWRLEALGRYGRQDREGTRGRAARIGAEDDGTGDGDSGGGTSRDGAGGRSDGELIACASMSAELASTVCTMRRSMRKAMPSSFPRANARGSFSPSRYFAFSGPYPSQYAVQSCPSGGYVPGGSNSNGVKSIGAKAWHGDECRSHSSRWTRGNTHGAGTHTQLLSRPAARRSALAPRATTARR